ncbi:MAG: DUF2461 domain-containing protein [Hungatella hathewayi]|nr:DUF2461 domain-containing protein [Hungatella hathewayi]
MSSQILSYLSALEQNNDREWYHAHKAELAEANREFEEIIAGLIAEIGKVDGSILYNVPKDLTFKLVRDTRFSHDKSPYNPSFRCHISSAGKLPIPVGYFLYIQPGNRSFLGGGLFADMFKDATTMVRDYLSTHGEEWEEIIQEESFRQKFQVQGTALKKVPAGYDKESPQAEFLKFKSWFIEDHFEDGLLEDKDEFIRYATERFLAMKPFNDYLNRALAHFTMPARP